MVHWHHASHERLFGRPQKEDSQSSQTGCYQERGCSHLWGEPFVGQALCQALAEQGSPLAPKKRPGSKPKMDESATKLLEADAQKRPAATLSERREFLQKVAGVWVSESSVSRMLRRLGWSRKKRSVGASERDEFLRAAWRSLWSLGRSVPSGWYSWMRWALTSRWHLCMPGRLKESERSRAFASVPRNWGKNVTLLASLSVRGMGPCLAVEGSTTTAVFEAYLERVLVPSLRPGQVVVMDNLSAHKGSRVRELIEGRGCELIYLPPYSPDFNPLEEAFAKIKGLLRKAEARSREVLIEAMGWALEMLTASDARNFFEHRGYRALDQLL